MLLKSWGYVILILALVVSGNYLLKKATLSEHLNYGYLVAMYLLWGVSIIPWVLLTKESGITLAVGLFQTANMGLTIFMGIFIFKEVLSIYQLIGIALVLCSGVLMSIR